MGSEMCIRDSTWPDEPGIGGRCDRAAPYPAGIPGMLPCGTGQALLIRVGAQKMGDDLRPGFEQGRLWPEKGPAEARADGEANVVLGTSGACPQKQRVPRWHLKIGRDRSLGMEPR